MSDGALSNDLLSPQLTFQEALAAATPTAFVTPALIGTNLLVYLAMVVSGVSALTPTAREVVPWGANFGPLTMSGQWWRLLTACFVHFGIIHIAMNMFILFQVGILTEKLFGNLRYLVLYLLAGVGGNIVGLYFHPMTVAAGASGAVFGVYGGLLAFLLIERGVVPAQSAWSIAKSAGIFIVYNLIYGMTRPETDIVAHIAGLITGFAVGLALARPLSPARHHLHPVRTLTVSLAGLGLSSLALGHVPKSSSSQSDWYRLTMVAPSVTVGTRDEVVYSGTATKADAENLARALQQIGFFRTPGILIQLAKGADGTFVSIPLNADESDAPSPEDDITTKWVNGKTVIVPKHEQHTALPWDDPVFLNSLSMLGPQLASALGGPPLTIRLLNGKGELRNEVKIDSAAVMIGPRDRVIYSGGATASDAEALGAVLKASGFFQDTGGIVHLAKGSGDPIVSFYMGNGSVWDDSRAGIFLQAIGHKIEKSVGGPPVRVQWLDNTGAVKKDVTVK